jgi:hypothetical protein
MGIVRAWGPWRKGCQTWRAETERARLSSTNLALARGLSMRRAYSLRDGMIATDLERQRGGGLPSRPTEWLRLAESGPATCETGS